MSYRMRVVGCLCGAVSIWSAWFPLPPPVGLTWYERGLAVIAGVVVIAAALTWPNVSKN